MFSESVTEYGYPDTNSNHTNKRAGSQSLSPPLEQRLGLKALLTSILWIGRTKELRAGASRDPVRRLLPWDVWVTNGQQSKLSWRFVCYTNFIWIRHLMLIQFTYRSLGSC